MHLYEYDTFAIHKKVVWVTVEEMEVSRGRSSSSCTRIFISNVKMSGSGNL